MIAASIYRRDINKEAKQVGAFFAFSLPARNKNRWNWASESLVYLHNRNPLLKVLHDLEELIKLMDQQFKLPPYLNYPEELEAALWVRLGEAYQFSDENRALEWYEKAFTRLRQEDELKESLAKTCYEYGKKLHGEKRYVESMRLLNRAIELISDYTYAYFNRGIAYYEQQEYLLAIADYDSAIRLNPEYTFAYHNRGLAYYKQQKYPLAIADYDSAIRLNPEYALAYLNRGNAYYAQQEYLLTIADYSQALKLNLDYNVYLRRGYSYLYLKNTEQARVDFIKGAEREPSNVNMAWMVIFTSLQKKRPNRAVADRLEEIALMDLQTYEAQICLGVALGLRSKLKDGLTKLDEALQTNPKSQDAHFWKGMLSAYYYQGRPQIAVEAIEKALINRLPPILLTPLYWLEKDNAQFFVQHAKPILERYGM
jgi:tetratricopeptide (TPR) repeat protein